MLNVMSQCRHLDEGLMATFSRGDIRLLRRAWVLEAPDQHLPYRQVLEERERRGEMPLLSPEEAAALLERGDRSIGALTQCAPPRNPPTDCTLQPNCVRTTVPGIHLAIRTRRASS